ncbi:hypothetical protein ACHAXR_013294 [Thalassiosira sp. AJA248-18]
MSLDSLLYSALGHNGDDLKFIFVGGKGGVGKTTSSSAIATLLAQHCNKRVLLVSTDPAHSLSDAFRCEFGNEPTSPGMENLHVMEVDPTETMERELNKWADLAKEIAVANDGEGDGKDGENDMVAKIKQFQEWLSGIPGIDEATALSSAIEHIESNKYDLIVFDTAPTGHTLKLLGMPDILQAGIEKLQGWQTTLWGYWDVLKGMGNSASRNRLHAKEEVAEMLENYKRGIQKVALMLQDQRRTRFVVVCIAEYLSVSETQRLLSELKKNRVRASHVIVNQLVVENALSKDELEELEGLAEVGSLMLNQELLAKTVKSCQLTTSRKGIQEKYLGQLRAFPETKDMLDSICEVPLLAEEVTGNEALRRFAEHMVRNPPSKAESASSSTDSGPVRLYDDELEKKSAGDSEEKKAEGEASSWTPSKGDSVKIKGLSKAAQYNGLEGVVSGALDAETNRCGVRIEYNGKAKTLALQMKNMTLLHKAKKAKSDKSSDSASSKSAASPPGGETMSKAMQVLEDPEIKALVDGNPAFKEAVEDCLANPMNIMKYLSDPEMAPLVSKAMSKLNF